MNRAFTSIPALCLRPLIVLAIGSVLTFGTVAPHEAAPDHEGIARGAFVDDAAQHPEAPPHFESSHTTYLPACHTCLMQLQTGSRLIAPPAPVPDLLRGEPVFVAAAAALSQAFPLFSPARAPPASSAVL